MKKITLTMIGVLILCGLTIRCYFRISKSLSFPNAFPPKADQPQAEVGNPSEAMTRPSDKNLSADRQAFGGDNFGISSSQENYAKLEYDEFIEDKNIKQDVIKVVKDYIAENVKKNGYLAVQDKSSNKMKPFNVIEVFDVVSRKDDVYTVQVDVDEINGEPRWVLFFDVKDINGVVTLVGVRNGGRHLRQSSVP